MIDLRLLGGLDIVQPRLPQTARSRRRHPMVLLALVAASAPQAVSRDRIMAFLWPESDAARASNSLRQALHSLRRDLGEDLFLPETSGGILLDRERITVDLWSFRDALARKEFGEAVALHRGPFLGGFQIAAVAEFSRWIEAERARVEREYLAALEALARGAEDEKRYDEAVTWRRRHAAADPFSSRAALGLLKALSDADDRPGALAYAAVYESFVRAHLEVAPDPVVTEFVAAVRRATPPGTRVSVDKPTSSAPAESGGPSVAVVLAPAGDGAAGMVTHRRRLATRRRWTVAAGLAAFGVVGIGAGYSMSLSAPLADSVIVLASGASNVAGRDTANQLVECAGPDCPAGRLPQAAYVVPAHEAYTIPASGTNFISPAPDGTTIEAPGYSCCSTATFENTFILPPDAATATISITVLADNQAIVRINGREFARQADSVSQWNFAGRPSTFATTFAPTPNGINHLRVTLWNGGGVGGLNYRAVVTYDRSRKAAAGDK